MLDTEQNRRAAHAVLPPGPRWPWPAQLVAYGPWPTRVFEHCARRYGDTFTLRLLDGARTVEFSAPEAVQAVIDLPATDFTVSTEFLEPIVGSRSVLLLDGEAHRHDRRLLLRAFHAESFSVHEQTMLDIATRHLEHWPTHQPVA